MFPPRIRLDQAFAHCPKFLTAALGAGALFNSGVAVRSHKPAGDHRFGGPLPIANFLIPGRIDLRRSSLFLAHPFRDGMLHPCAALSGIEIPDRRVDYSSATHPYAALPNGEVPKNNPSAEPSTSMC